MNPEFLRLVILGNRRAFGRLLAIAAGIAMGTAFILLLAGAFNALAQREVRSAWIKPVGEVPPESAMNGGIGLLAPVQDWHNGEAISRIDVYRPNAATSHSAAIPVWPLQGEFFASPALADRIEAAPVELLGERYGRLAGIIDMAHLKGPEALVAVVGQPLDAMLPRAGLILADTARPAPDTESKGFQAVAAIGAIGMIFPVLLFVYISARLGAATREEAYATLRLLGATPGQTSLVAGVEMLLVSSVGAVLGIIAARVLCPFVARYELAGASFFAADLEIGPVATFVIAFVIVAAATIVGAIGMWRTRLGPLGPTRAIAEKPVHWRQVLITPVGLGLTALTGPGLLGGRLPPDMASLLFLAGFSVTSLGVVLMGPWLTALAGRLVLRCTGSAAGLIVANRISQAPRATFRSVSGLVLAVFMVTVFAVASSGVASRFQIQDTEGRIPPGALFVRLLDGAAIPASIPGSTRLVIGYKGDSGETSIVFAGKDLGALGFARERTAEATYEINLAEFLSMTGSTPAARLETAKTPAEPIVLIALTDGSPPMLEAARTFLQRNVRWTLAPMTRAEANLLGANRTLKELSLLAYSGALITILIAGLSLTLSTLGNMLDRRRVFGLLRLTGMPASLLDRVVLLEAAVPLAAVLILSIAAGWVSAFLIVRTLSDTIGIGTPEPAYFIFLSAGLVGALLILQITKWLARRLVGGEAVRFM